MKSIQEFAITFGENVLRYSDGWQYKLLKHRELCSEGLAEPVGHGSCAVPVPAAPSPAAGRAQREGAAALPACGKTPGGGRLGRRCDVCLSFLTLSRLAKWVLRKSSVLLDTAKRN